MPRRLLLAAALPLLAVACRDGTSPRPPVLTVAAGDGQRAVAGSELPAFVIVELRDAAALPLVGVRVVWTATSGSADVIAAEAPVTDAAGLVRARWRLDGKAGQHLLVVTTENGASAQLNAWADALPPPNVHPMPMITYDGSGQMVHPDVVRVPASWNGDPMRLVATPYPNGDASHENPSLYTGTTGTAWSIPTGVRNPLVRPAGGYLSDPDMLYDPDARELRIYYRRVTNENEIWLIRSSDGAHWSAPVLTVRAPNHRIISPTVVRRSAGVWLMWSVNAGTAGCVAASTSVELRRSADGVGWSSPETVTLSDPDGFAWHIEVEWIPSRQEYWALYPVKQAGGCSTDRLRLATSADGLRWQSYPSPVLRKGASDELKDVVYRSSLDYDAASGIVWLWYSGARLGQGGYAWHLAWERLSLTSLFARINVPVTLAAARTTVQPSARASERPVPKAAELTNETAP